MRRFFQKHLDVLVTPAARDLGGLRVLAAMAAFAVMALHVASRITHPGSYDPLGGRLFFAGALLVALGLSFVLPSFQRRFTVTLWTIGLGFCLWMVWLTYRNDFDPGWVLTSSFFVLGCVLSIPWARPQLFFSVLVLGSFAVVYLVEAETSAARLSAVLQLIVFCVFVGLATWMRDRWLNRMERLSLVARQTHAAVLILDPEGRPEWSNVEARELMGQWREALEDAKGSGPLDDAEAERLRVFRGRIALAQPFRQEVRLADSAGRSRWVDLDVTPITSPRGSGRVTGHVVVGRDVTDQKEAEKELRRSEGRYRRLVERSPMPIIALQGPRILYANRAAARLLRVAAPSLLSGRSFVDQIEEGGRRDAEVWLDRVRLEDGGSREFSMERMDGGGMVEVLAQASSVIFAGQEVLQLVLSDLTERKQVERAKDEFVSTVNHELRTPLTSLRGSLGLLDAGLFEEGGEKARMLIDLALRNTERLTLLINDLLDMQKIEAGKADFRMEVVDLTELVRAAVESNQLFADRFDVTFRLVRELPGGLVYADPNRLAQVLSNLLSNAAKFSPQGSAVDIFVDRTDQGLRVTVVDRGPGVPASFKDQLFRKFSRAEPTRSHQVPGTGLGLAISRAIIEQHGGNINLDHDFTEGASFFFVLPETDLLARTPTAIH